ncbi:MAG: hypothetical protein ABI391_06750 [Hyphomicrobiaceae bacterium]
MMDGDDDFVAALRRTALAAQREEISFRDNVAREIAVRELARKYAFRRLTLAELMMQVARRAQSEEQAIAAQTAAMRAEFDWHGDTERRRRIFAAWRPVALAAWTAVRPRSTEAGGQDPAPVELPDIGAALATFEAWYLAEFGSNYLDILEVEMEELPVVEF